MYLCEQFFPLVNNKMKNKSQLTDGHVQSVMAVFPLLSLQLYHIGSLKIFMFLFGLFVL